MAARLPHRGPDGQGDFVSGPCALGHRRLAIQDPALGAQPMSDSEGIVHITYNGEIYNYPELRSELLSKGVQLKTHSDTEAILYCYLLDPENFVSRLSGIFGFAIWDTRNQILTVARDYIGVKPVYLYADNDFAAIASEIKALLADPRVPCRPDMPAIAEVLSFQNVHGNRTCFEGIELLWPGEIVRICRDGHIKRSRYFKFQQPQRLMSNRREATDTLRDLLPKVIKSQLLSDVPIGSFLSGGMDTGAITALASLQLGRLKTFSGGFDIHAVDSHEKAFDERAAAALMSARLNTEHEFTEVRSQDLLDNFGQILWHLEEPRGSTCYAPFVMARQAGAQVKVVLSGHGGDELFCGYRGRYQAAKDYGADWESKWLRQVNHVISAEKLPEFLNPDAFDFDAKSHVLESYAAAIRDSHGLTPVSRAQHYDLFTYMQGLLSIEDKLSMAHSLESRVPLLDRALYDFAWSLPEEWKLSDELGKVILRDALTDILPSEILGRDKMGFGPPDNSYYRTDLRRFFEDVLLNGLAKRGIVRRSIIETILDEHLAGAPRANVLWTLASTEMWFQTFHDRIGARAVDQGPVSVSTALADVGQEELDASGDSDGKDFQQPALGSTRKTRAIDLAKRGVLRLRWVAGRLIKLSRRTAGAAVRSGHSAAAKLKRRAVTVARRLIRFPHRIAEGAARRGHSAAAKLKRRAVTLAIPPAFRVYMRTALRLSVGPYNLNLRAKLNPLLKERTRRSSESELAVFHGLYSTVQPHMLSNELRRFGWRSRYETVDHNPNFKQADAIHNDIYHPDFYYEHVKITGKGIQPRLPALTDDFNLTNLERFFLQRWGKYDVFHFNWFLSFLPNQIDVEYIRKSGSAVYFHWRGCFILTKLAPEFAAKGQSVADACAACKARGWRREYFARFARGIEHASRVIVSTPNLCHCDERFEYAPLSLDPALASVPIRKSRVLPDNAPVVVMHAPSSSAMEEVKGTEHVRAAVEHLVSEGFNLILQMVQNLPRQDAIMKFRDADIFVEQLTLGSYGNTAIEAMAHGVPVISSHHPDHAHLAPGCPIVHADPTTLVDRLRELIADKEARERIGRQSYEFVRTFHGNGQVAGHFDRLYREDLGRLEKRPPNTLANGNPHYGPA